MSDHENLLLKLRQEASGYSPTQQKLGEFVLNDPARVLYLTITELARESGTSEASVTRLCRTLGCKIPQNSSTGPSLNRRHWPCIRRSQCKFTGWRPA